MSGQPRPFSQARTARASSVSTVTRRENRAVPIARIRQVQETLMHDLILVKCRPESEARAGAGIPVDPAVWVAGAEHHEVMAHAGVLWWGAPSSPPLGLAGVQRRAESPRRVLIHCIERARRWLHAARRLFRRRGIGRVTMIPQPDASGPCHHNRCVRVIGT